MARFRRVKMNVMALKFLRHEPAENWFDYFLHRDRFLALLRDENAGDRPLTFLVYSVI